VTWTSLSRSKVKGRSHQAALLTAAFTHQAAAAVTVGTYCYVAARRGRGHIVAAPAQLVFRVFDLQFTRFLYRLKARALVYVYTL